MRRKDPAIIAVKKSSRMIAAHAKFFFILLMAGLLVVHSTAQVIRDSSLSPRFETSYRVYPGNVSQTEVFITQDPTNEDILWISCNTLNFIPFFISEGIYVTTDGGAGWRGSDTCSGSPLAFHGGDPGITITHQGTFILTRLGRSPFVGLYSHYSTDQGATWSAQKVISTDDLERATLATNTIPGTPGYGRTYAAWIKFAYPFPMMLATSDDAAQTWSVPQQLNQPSDRSAGGDIAIGPQGEVYLCWAAVTNVSPFKEIQVGFGRSVDGGESWNVNEKAFAVNGITGVLPNKENIRVNGLPSIAVDNTNGPRRGWIYIVTGQKELLPAGSDPDIVLYRSTDGGSTWSPGIRVNRDPLNNGKTQYFATVHVDREGAVNVLFYDDRNTTADSASVFLARSLDGGNQFLEYEISSHRFKPRPIGGLGQGYQGDNIDITSTGTHLWPVWMDNSTGVYQVWTVPVRYQEVSSTPGTKKPDQLPSIVVRQDPDGYTTWFNLTVPGPGHAKLEVFEIPGRLVATPVNAELTGGTHAFSINWPSSRNAQPVSQLMVYRLTWNNRVVSGKFMLLR